MVGRERKQVRSIEFVISARTKGIGKLEGKRKTC